MPELDPKISDRVLEKIKQDMYPSPLITNLKIAGSFLCGGLASLLYCAQFGIMKTTTSVSTHDWIHKIGGELGCPYLSGLAFTILPMIILRFLSSPLQFKGFINQKSHLIFLWGVFTGCSLYIYSDANQLIHLALWTLAIAPASSALFLNGKRLAPTKAL